MALKILKRPFFIQPKIISKKTTLQFLHPPDTCYAIVSKIEDYPKFVSWIQDVKPLPNTDSYFITIGFPPFIQSYTSQAIKNPPLSYSLFSKENEVFELLESIWEFSPAKPESFQPGSKVPLMCEGQYSVKFKFASPIYQKFSQVVINKVFSETSKAFVKYINQSPSGINLKKSST